MTADTQPLPPRAQRRHPQATAVATPARLLVKKRRAGELLDMSPATIDRYIKAGFLEKVVFGTRHVRVTMASIEALLNQPASAS